MFQSCSQLYNTHTDTHNYGQNGASFFVYLISYSEVHSSYSRGSRINFNFMLVSTTSSDKSSIPLSFSDQNCMRACPVCATCPVP